MFCSLWHFERREAQHSRYTESQQKGPVGRPRHAPRGYGRGYRADLVPRFEQGSTVRRHHLLPYGPVWGAPCLHQRALQRHNKQGYIAPRHSIYDPYFC